MDMIADGLLIGGALTAAFYCWVLSVRVRGLKDLDTGLGGAIAGLSKQVDEMQTTLQAAKSFSADAREELEELSDRADAAANRLRLLLATVHEDAPKAKRPKPARKKTTARAKAPAAAASDAPKPVAKAKAPEARADAPVTAKAAPVDAAAAPAPKPDAEPAAEPKAEPRPAEAAAKPAAPDKATLAQQLQQDIKQKIVGRSEERDSDEFVKALQDIMAAGK